MFNDNQGVCLSNCNQSGWQRDHSTRLINDLINLMDMKILGFQLYHHDINNNLINSVFIISKSLVGLLSIK